MNGEAAPLDGWTRERERGSLFMLRVMSWISRRLGRRVARVVLHGIVVYFLLFAPRARAPMRAYLRRALGREPGMADLYRHLLAFATTIHDRVYLFRDEFQRFDITLEGEQLVIDRDARREGAFLMGSHLGSFEATRALGRSRSGVPNKLVTSGVFCPLRRSSKSAGPRSKVRARPAHSGQTLN